jgi:hypothetical protein
MLRLSCDAVDAPCGCEFSTTGRTESCSRKLLRCALATNRVNLEQSSSGSRVPKVEVTGQYKLASRSASCVHGSLARARNRGDGSKRGGSFITCDESNSPHSCASGTDSPPILDDNGLQDQRLDQRLILPAGSFNHVMRFRPINVAMKLLATVIGLRR